MKLNFNCFYCRNFSRTKVNYDKIYFLLGDNIADNKKIEEEAKKVAEKVAEEVTENIKKTAEEATEEVKKAGKEAAKEIKASAEETEIFQVEESSAVAGRTVEDIDKQGLLGKDALIVEIESNDEKVTPKGDTVLEAGDTVTVTSSSGISEKTRIAFNKE